MVKRFLATKGWVLISVTVMSSAIIIVMYDRFKAAEKNLAEYKLAISCPSQDNCRRKLDAKISETHASQIYIGGFEFKGGRTTSFSDTTYVFTISSEIGNQVVKISANPLMVRTPFDIGNVHIPPDSGAKFIQENFYKGETVFIETWRNEVMFLFVDSIINFPEIVVQPTALLGTPEHQAAINALSPKTYEIAMPTLLHPVFLHATAQYDLFSATLLCLLITGATFVIMLRKDN